MTDRAEGRFQGEHWDVDLDLAIHGARYYAANVGRWWTMDSWEGDQNDPTLLHKYLGFGNSPVNMVDPSGHDYTIATTVSANTGIQTTARTSGGGVSSGALQVGVTVGEWNATAAAYQTGVSGSLLYKGIAAGIVGATIAAHLASVATFLDPVDSVIAARNSNRGGIDRQPRA